MKKTIGTILMVIGVVAFVILMMGEYLLFKDNKLPTDVYEWIGNLVLPVVSICLFFIGKKLRK